MAWTFFKNLKIIYYAALQLYSVAYNNYPSIYYMLSFGEMVYGAIYP